MRQKPDPDLPCRRSVRLQKYDYATPCAYFITICVVKHRPVPATIEGSAHQLTHAGRIVEAAWYDLPNRFPWVGLDAMVVMPNHVHGVIHIESPDGQVIGERPFATQTGHVGSPGVMNHAPTRCGDGSDGYSPVALGEIVRTFKASATRSIRINALPDFAWQRNYYEHIIRNDRSLERIRDYIAVNPVTWSEDNYYVAGWPALFGC